MHDLPFIGIDWRSMLCPKIPLTDVAVRTVIVFFVLQVGMRFLGRQNMQQTSSFRLVTLFLIGAFGGRAVLGEDTSVTSCALGLLVTLALNSAVAYGIHRSRRFAEWIEGPVVCQLIKGGVVQDQAMAQTHCTLDLIKARLRGQGETDLSRVKDAYYERHGEITLIMW